MVRETNSTDRPVATRATQRLRELEARGVELCEILGGEAGATFIRDACEGDPKVAYAAIALVYFPRTHERGVGEQGEANGSEKSLPPALDASSSELCA